VSGSGGATVFQVGKHSSSRSPHPSPLPHVPLSPGLWSPFAEPSHRERRLCHRVRRE
jgi:hypothetical protein